MITPIIEPISSNRHSLFETIEIKKLPSQSLRTESWFIQSFAIIILNFLNLHKAMMARFLIANLWLLSNGNVHFKMELWKETSNPPKRFKRSARMSKASNWTDWSSVCNGIENKYNKLKQKWKDIPIIENCLSCLFLLKEGFMISSFLLPIQLFIQNKINESRTKALILCCSGD